MEAIREIVEVKKGKIMLQLPASFTATRVELIVLPADSTPPAGEMRSVNKNISSLRGKLSSKNEAAVDQQLREEWESNT